VLDVPALVRVNTAQIEVDILRELQLGARLYSRSRSIESVCHVRELRLRGWLGVALTLTLTTGARLSRIEGVTSMIEAFVEPSGAILN
jgi:hypothetical protein